MTLRSLAFLPAAFLASQTPTDPAVRSCASATAIFSGVLVWGGARACGVDVVNDSAVWSWNGSEWKIHSKLPLAPREDALLVAGNQQLWLFGGRRSGTAFDDVWHHEGNAWRRITATGGPGAIQHGAAAFDRRRNRVVVFGGAVGRSTDARTFEWDGTRWHAFDVPGPGVRVGHAMAWSDADGGVLLYGGFSERGQLRDLWRWDGSRWTQLSSEGPTHTEGAMICEAPAGIYISGAGLDAVPDAPVKLWQWTGGKFVELSASRRASRIGSTTVFDRERMRLLLFGGADHTGNPDASMLEFDGANWRSIARSPR